jgi:iron complex outermembrane recepter protein
VRRTLVLSLMATVALPVSLAARQLPDSALTIAPILVRVLRSTIGSGTPYAVSVAAGPELTRGSAGAFLEEALRAVPGVQIQNRFNLAVGERLSIRGAGPRAQFGVRGVRVLVDGIPATLPDGQATLDHLDLAGLGRVEVLRGPAAALYGNASGGVIHFRTLDPARTPASLTLRTTAGSFGLRTTQLVTSGRSGDTGYRLAFSRLTYDGFRRNPVADDNSVYGAATRSVVNGTVTRPLGAGTLRLVANAVDLDAANPGSLSESLLSEGDRQAYRFNVISRTRKDVRQGQIGASWTGPVGAGSGQFSAWGIRRELENPIPGTVIGLDRNAGGFRALVEGKRSVGSGTLALGAGIEAEFQHDDRVNWKNEGGEKGALKLSQVERVRGSGAFIHTRLDLSGGLSLQGGLRYDRIRFSARDRFVTADDPDDSGSRTMDALSPSAGVVFAASPSLEFFGSVARFFETPTTTELVNRPSGAGGFNPTLEPQRGTTVEGGLRVHAKSVLSLEATLFRTELDNELVPFEVPSDPGRSYFRNAGASRHTGWEISADGRIGEGGSLRVAYTRIDGRFETFRTDDADYSGNRVPGLAPYRIDALAQFDLGPGFLDLRGLYQDAVPVDNAGLFTSPAYFIAETRVGLSSARLGRFDASPFFAVSNLFDRRYNSSVIVNAFGKRYFEPGPGRSYRIGAGITWSR